MSALYSSKTGPQVSVRADAMGVATVKCVSSTKAVLINEFDEPMVVTPKDTFNDARLDLNEKLREDLRLVYKAIRLVANDNYKWIVVYVRPLNDCFVGHGILVQVNKTFAYAESSKHGSIFFPANAIKDGLISQKFMRDIRDITKGLRVGDPITYVAVKDDTTKGRSIYALDVHLDINENVNKPMIGIITAVTHVNCHVWAKNFPRLTFHVYHFGLDPNVDLRHIFNEGDRITFRAAYIGSQMDGISDVKAADPPQLEKLQRFKVLEKGSDTGFMVSKKEMESDFVEQHHSPTWISTSTYGAVGTKQNYGHSSGVPSTGEGHRGMLQVLEDELNDLDVDDLNDATNYRYAQAIDQGIVSKANDQFFGAMLTKPVGTVDAETQVNNLTEVDVMKELLSDKEIFTMICQRFPDLIHEYFQAKR